MSHLSMILTTLMTMAMLLVFAPGIFAINRGHILRNIALWLAIFLGLALLYQNFGPDSPHPLFQTPEAMQGMHPVIKAPESSKDDPARTDQNKDNDTQGFMPPKD